MMERYYRKLISNVTGKFNHFSKVTRYPVKVQFERFSGDNEADPIFNIEIGGIDNFNHTNKHHCKRLRHLCERIEDKYQIGIFVTNTRMDPQKKAFHDATFYNRKSIERSKMCGCYYCESIFPAAEITDDNYTDEGTTACCPYCGMDSVYGDASGIELTAEKLRKLNRRWFGDY